MGVRKVVGIARLMPELSQGLSHVLCTLFVPGSCCEVTVACDCSMYARQKGLKGSHIHIPVAALLCCSVTKPRAWGSDGTLKLLHSYGPPRALPRFDHSLHVVSPPPNVSADAVCSTTDHIVMACFHTLMPDRAICRSHWDIVSILPVSQPIMIIDTATPFTMQLQVSPRCPSVRQDVDDVTELMDNLASFSHCFAGRSFAERSTPPSTLCQQLSTVFRCA
jgi:hypothetical protein